MIVGAVSDSVKEADKVNDEASEEMSKEMLEPRDSVENAVEIDNDAVSEYVELDSEAVTVMLSTSVVVVTEGITDVVSTAEADEMMPEREPVPTSVEGVPSESSVSSTVSVIRVVVRSTVVLELYLV